MPLKITSLWGLSFSPWCCPKPHPSIQLSSDAKYHLSNKSAAFFLFFFFTSHTNYLNDFRSVFQVSCLLGHMNSISRTGCNRSIGVLDQMHRFKHLHHDIYDVTYKCAPEPYGRSGQQRCWAKSSRQRETKYNWQRRHFAFKIQVRVDIWPRGQSSQCEKQPVPLLWVKMKFLRL